MLAALLATVCFAQQSSIQKEGNSWTDVVNGSVSESFKMLRPWLKSCHINELHKDLAGKYPYRELFRLFRENGYDRVTMCEVGQSVPEEKYGTEMLRYYKALWTELAHG